MVQKRNAVVKGSGQGGKSGQWKSGLPSQRGDAGVSRRVQHFEQTGNNFPKILVQCGGLYDLQATATNRNYLSL